MKNVRYVRSLAIYMKIPRELRPGQPPFNPIELSYVTEKIVAKDLNHTQLRKYTHFRVVRFYRGAATAFTVGCNLRCFFCWSQRARDYPEIYGKYYTPKEVVDKLVELCRTYNTNRARLSGGEPTITRKHLIELLKLVDEERHIEIFILETNGLLLGYDRSFVKDLARSCSKLVVRVSIKAGNSREFQKRTGSAEEFYWLPFQAIEHLIREGVRVYVAILVDPRLVPIAERRSLISKLASIDPRLVREVEEEIVELFPEARRRLELYGIKL